MVVSARLTRSKQERAGRVSVFELAHFEHLKRKTSPLFLVLLNVPPHMALDRYGNFHSLPHESGRVASQTEIDLVSECRESEAKTRSCVSSTAQEKNGGQRAKVHRNGR